jgi:glycosyltransferase involved in cell wall biosynthesis
MKWPAVGDAGESDSWESSNMHAVPGDALGPGDSRVPRILFITGASHAEYMRNMNHFQRVYFLSRQTQLTVFGRKGANFSLSAAEGTEIITAPFKGKLGVILACLFWMIARGRSKRYDIVLTEPSKLCICGLFGKIVLGAKWVVDVWDMPFRCQSRHYRRKLRTWVDRAIARRMFRLTDLFLLSILPDFEFAEFTVPKDRLLLLKNAIWLDRRALSYGGYRQASNGEFRILCMRSCFTEDSGLDTLAEAFAELSRSYDNVSLMIVGRVPCVVERQVSRLRHHPGVFFRDFAEHNELMHLVRSSAVCVVPFRNTMDLAQTYPIKVLEYLSCGAVVLASDLPGIASIIEHGDNGFLFRPDDPADLLARLRAVYEDPEWAARISSKAACLGDEFDCRNKAVSILSALERVASKAERNIG